MPHSGMLTGSEIILACQSQSNLKGILYNHVQYNNLYLIASDTWFCRFLSNKIFTWSDCLQIILIFFSQLICTSTCILHVSHQ